MFYERRQNFDGQFTPEWFVNTWHTRHRPQPTVLVIQVPQRTTGYGMQSYGFGLPQKPSSLRRTNFQINHKSSAQKLRDFKRRQTFLERKTICLSLPGAEKVQVGKDQEKAHSEKDSHSKNRGGKKPN